MEGKGLNIVQLSFLQLSKFGQPYNRCRFVKGICNRIPTICLRAYPPSLQPLPMSAQYAGGGGCSAGHQEARGTHRPSHGGDHGDDAQVRHRHQVCMSLENVVCQLALWFARGVF